jgi:hypothetical protein
MMAPMAERNTTRGVGRLLAALAAACLLSACGDGKRPVAPTSSAQTRSVRDFVRALEANKISIKQHSETDCALFFSGCKKGHHLYPNSLEEWIEVYEFDSAASAEAAYPKGSHTIPLSGRDVKVAFKDNLALFVYDQHSQWPDVWRVWQGWQ